jgi:hypothetical protein
MHSYGWCEKVMACGVATGFARCGRLRFDGAAMLTTAPTIRVTHACNLSVRPTACFDPTRSFLSLFHWNC